jgi:hypothetical protein
MDVLLEESDEHVELGAKNEICIMHSKSYRAVKQMSSLPNLSYPANNIVLQPMKVSRKLREVWNLSLTLWEYWAIGLLNPKGTPIRHPESQPKEWLVLKAWGWSIDKPLVRERRL